MTRIRCLAACVGLVLLTQGATMAQVRSTLDAQFPSDHEYVVAVWFEKKDKAGTFQSRIMDPSIPGNYDRRAWEDAKTKWNDPNGTGVMRIFPVRTWQSMGATEREQVMARIKQERDRIEFQDLPSVDVKPEKKEKPKQEPKKDSGKTTFSYNENAKKSNESGSLVGSTWSIGEDEQIVFHPDGELRSTYALVGQNLSATGRWSQTGDKVGLYIDRLGNDGRPVRWRFEGKKGKDKIEGENWIDGSGLRGSISLTKLK